MTMVFPCGPKSGWLAAALRLMMLMAPMALLPGPAAAQAPDIKPPDEQVISIPKKSGLFTVSLEATLFKPDGDGPFPLVIINHGKVAGDPRFQPRFRPMRLVRFFLNRGYAIVVPMRQGFSKSGGAYVGAGCNVESNGRTQAEDVAATQAFMATQPFVDAARILIVGQSHGGWTTLAYGASSPAPGVKGLVNFVGGLRQDTCAGWEDTLIRSAGALGADSRLPSLWFYGDNDSFFQPFVWQGMHKAYTNAGGDARLVAFGRIDGDAHALISQAAGDAIWQPEMARFLAQIGLPHEPAPRTRVAAVPAADR